ncbi:hypothetical protein GCM10027047_39350 [Rhodococcus aerolatus]
MIGRHEIDRLRGGTAYDSEGHKVGKVGEVYLDNHTGDPAWATVNTGLLGTRQTFVPLHQASVDGADLRLPITKAAVKDAPHIGDDEALSPEAETALYRHYGLDTREDHDAGNSHDTRSSHDTGGRDSGRHPGRDEVRGDGQGRGERDDHRVGEELRTEDGVRDKDTGRGDRSAHGDVIAGAAAGAVGEGHRTERTRDEGRGDTATHTGTGDGQGPRLRKHVVTEMQTITVPVEREVYTLEDGTEVDAPGTTGTPGTRGEGQRPTPGERDHR